MAVFNFVNRRIKSNTTSAGLKMEDGTITTDHYLTELRPLINSLEVCSHKTTVILLMSKIVLLAVAYTVCFTSATVRQTCFSKTETTTSIGCDDIPNLFLKRCTNQPALLPCHILAIH